MCIRDRIQGEWVFGATTAIYAWNAAGLDYGAWGEWIEQVSNDAELQNNSEFFDYWENFDELTLNQSLPL